MAYTTSLPGDLVIPGNLRISGTISPAMAKSDILELAELQAFTVPMRAWREHDAYATNLPGTPVGGDHLGCVGGTFNTNAPSLQTDDFGGNAAVEHFYARAEIPLPWNYVAGQTVKIRVHAGVLTTVASESATVDLQVYSSDEDETSTGDLCTTTAEDINSLVFADSDFTITATSLNPGDILDVMIDVAVDDDTDSGIMKACIGSVQLLCDVR